METIFGAMIFELAEMILGALAEIICGGFRASAPLADGATVVVGVSVVNKSKDIKNKTY